MIKLSSIEKRLNAFNTIPMFLVFSFHVIQIQTFFGIFFRNSDKFVTYTGRHHIDTYIQQGFKRFYIIQP